MIIPSPQGIKYDLYSTTFQYAILNNSLTLTLKPSPVFGHLLSDLTPSITFIYYIINVYLYVINCYVRILSKWQEKKKEREKRL